LTQWNSFLAWFPGAIPIELIAIKVIVVGHPLPGCHNLSNLIHQIPQYLLLSPHHGVNNHLGGFEHFEVQKNTSEGVMNR
jgi:hypothetical protein